MYDGQDAPDLAPKDRPDPSPSAYLVKTTDGLIIAGFGKGGQDYRTSDLDLLVCRMDADCDPDTDWMIPATFWRVILNNELPMLDYQRITYQAIKTAREYHPLLLS